jgi:hypothetical protein
MVAHPTADPRRTIGWTEAAFRSSEMVGPFRRRSVTRVVRQEESEVRMGVSIYYEVSRPQPLSPDERRRIATIVARYPVEALIAQCGVIEDEFYGEPFCVYPTDEDTEPGVVFEGATKLPLCSEDVYWAAVQYWCRLLSEVRRVLPDASWRVHIDDHHIAWDKKLQVFDPSV